ncbi:hypothetical protein XA3_14870 [Xylocopilactobacillus apicola]|uniref:BspA family leucine-rich repeat surface protein n=1 Tax=Xylocopilactobacillus apicola TaxID=2932184 RepID=A0AAU9D2M2_9LACO|nr:hypothetical protein XA3_14870 [Xylocopilactobacillus apicola]
MNVARNNYDKYLHIVAIDNNGNVSSTANIKLLDYLWWNVDSNNVLTIYPHELNFDVDKKIFNSGNNVSTTHWPWYLVRGQITKTLIKPGVTCGNNLSELFSGMEKMSSIEGIENLNTSNVTKMNSMFHSCYLLASLNVANFDTASVTDMEMMFERCRALTSLDVTNFNTASVINMRSMFEECTSLTNLDVRNFNTQSVTNMMSMFSSCQVLPSLDVRNFNTTSVTNMGLMFNGCTSLKNLDVTNFNTTSVTNMVGMFRWCNSLTSLDVTNFNTTSVTNMGEMFSFCHALTDLDITGFDTSSVTNMSEMFRLCMSLPNIDVSQLKLDKFTDISHMFENCYKLKSIDVSNFNTKSVTDMSFMFDGCEALTSINLGDFKTNAVTNMNYMFRDCKSLTSLDLSKFDLSKIVTTTSGSIFEQSGYSFMLGNTSALWKLTLGPKTKFPDVTVGGIVSSADLSNPTPGTAIKDLAKPVPPNSQYYAADPQWREVSTPGSEHAPDGAAKTAAEILSESATRNDVRTYVWDQTGRVLLEAPTAIDFGAHRGSVRNHNYESDNQKFTVTDNRNSRKNKKWRIEGAMTQPLTKGTKRITGNPLHHKNGSGEETNLTPVATQLAEKVIPGVLYEDTWEEPWNLIFKATANELPEAGSYSGEVTYTLLDSTP